MRTRYHAMTAGLLGAAAWLSLAVPATAQFGGTGQGYGPAGQNRQGYGPAGQNGQGGQMGQRQPPKNYLAELKTVADDVAKRYQVKIVVDPAAFVAATPKIASNATTIETAMDSLAKQVRGGTWRRAYLNQTQANTVPAPEKLVDVVRALDRVEQSGIILENPATKRATAYMKNYAVSSTFKDDLAAQSFNTAPVYVLYAAAEAGGTPDMDRFMDLQRQQMDMMMRMDPDSMARAMQNSMNMFMSADPQTRQQFMGNMMRSGMQMFMNMPAEQRNALMQEAMRNAQQMFGGQGGQGQPGR